MSARPDVPRLAEEDLDLLISRSLDGDLSPEEEQQLERLVALDPAAARRRDELATLVADVKALPEPATPFALSTRVNGNVAERAGRPGSLGGRVGFFPAPGFAKTALVVLAVVGAAIAILRPVPKRLVEGPVDVLLYSPPPAAPAPQSVVAEAKPEARPEARTRARLDDNERRQETDELRKEVPAEASAGRKNAAETAERIAGKQAAAKLERAAEKAPAASGSSNLLAGAETKKTDLDAGAALGGAVAQAPAKITSAGEPAAVAPALRSVEVARAKAASAPRGWTVSVVGDAARRWALRRAPDTYPAPASNRPALFSVALDASGRVASARRVGTELSEPGLDEFVRGMLFDPLPGVAGAIRDGKDAPAPATIEIEVELVPR